MAPFTIRRATLQDISAVQEIEQSATKRFATIAGLEDLATGPPPTEATVQDEWLDNGGRIYLQEDLDGKPIGFIAAHPLDNTIYIAELSVFPSHQGQGVGTRLLMEIFTWARESGPHLKVSLITYAKSVPWNGPWYEKRGFKFAVADAIGSQHMELLKSEDEINLSRPGHRRCVMLWEDYEGTRH